METVDVLDAAIFQATVNNAGYNYVAQPDGFPQLDPANRTQFTTVYTFNSSVPSSQEKQVGEVMFSCSNRTIMSSSIDPVISYNAGTTLYDVLDCIFYPSPYGQCIFSIRQVLCSERPHFVC